MKVVMQADWRWYCDICQIRHFEAPGVPFSVADASARRHECWHKAQEPIAFDPAMAEAL